MGRLQAAVVQDASQHTWNAWRPGSAGVLHGAAVQAAQQRLSSGKTSGAPSGHAIHGEPQCTGVDLSRLVQLDRVQAFGPESSAGYHKQNLRCSFLAVMTTTPVSSPTRASAILTGARVFLPGLLSTTIFVSSTCTVAWQHCST